MTEIDLNDVKLKGEPKKEEVIQLTDDIGITLTYPKVKDLMGIDTDASQSNLLLMLSHQQQKIYMIKIMYMRILQKRNYLILSIY